MKLLLVEDDIVLAEGLRDVLQREGYTVELSHDGVDGEFLGSELELDAIILDLGLPKRPGLEVLRHWREKQVRTPVIILTARDSWQERVDGLKAGADDYLGKPFHHPELLARLQAVLRRHHGHASNRLTAGSIALDLDSQQLSIADGEPQQLSGIEFRLMHQLLSQPQRILSKTELSEHIYQEELQRDSNVLEVYINRLRRRFGKQLIETHRGQGYRLGSAAP